jgi:hypothetical protein
MLITFSVLHHVSLCHPQQRHDETQHIYKARHFILLSLLLATDYLVLTSVHLLHRCEVLTWITVLLCALEDPYSMVATSGNPVCGCVTGYCDGAEGLPQIRSNNVQGSCAIGWQRAEQAMYVWNYVLALRLQQTATVHANASSFLVSKRTCS